MCVACFLQRGAIYLDGVHLPEIQHEWLHSQVQSSSPRCLQLLHTGASGSDGKQKASIFLLTLLRMQVSIVSQEPILFAESILYNITFGVQDPMSISLAQVVTFTLLRPLFLVLIYSQLQV